MSYYNSISERVGNYNVFTDTSLTNIWFDDCNESTTGKCEIIDKLEKCLKICERDNCNYGYYLETPDGENICLPIEKKVNINPYYRLLNQSHYQELKGLKSTVFVDERNYNFPPKDMNNIFYTKNLYLTNNKTKKSIGTISDLKTPLSNSPLNIRFLSREISQPYALSDLVVHNGDEVMINVPNTVLVLSLNTEGKIEWNTHITFEPIPMNIFTVYSVDKTKKIGDPLTYEDEIYFKNSGKIVKYYKEGDKDVLKVSEEDEISENDKYTVTPNYRVYYCGNGNSCEKIELKDTDKGKYLGKEIYNSPVCWNKCERKDLENEVDKELYKEEIDIKFLIISLVVIILITIFIMNYSKRKLFS